MALDNEQIVRQAYKVAEEMDMAAWVAAFTEDGTFTDESIGVTWQGPGELPEQVENYHRAFPDMHRELYHVYVSGNIVVVQLALQGTHLGPLRLPAGTLPPTGKRMDAPCCDVFELVEARSSGSTATPKARSSSASSACSATSAPRSSTDRMPSVVQLRQGVTTSLREAPVLRCSQVPLMSSSRVCSRSTVNLPSVAWPAICA